MRAVPTKSIALFASCVALLLPSASAAQNDVDLDQLAYDHLSQALNAELDDVFERLNADDLYELNDLVNVIMHALSDAGDDYTEQTIDMEDLVEEMQEAGVSLRNIVAGAVRQADQESENGRGGTIRVQNPDAPRWSPPTATPRVAVPKAKAAVTQAIQYR